MYTIDTNTDFQNGATLVVKIPKNDIDVKAFRTILGDTPDFIVPFKYRIIENEFELTYKIGHRNKLSYLSGFRTNDEYRNLWLDVVNPLMECDDWFMKPYSFMFDYDYLYFDKDTNKVQYIYIPSCVDISSIEYLKRMMKQIAKHNSIDDLELANKVIWGIEDFNPIEFVKMIKGNKVKSKTHDKHRPVVDKNKSDNMASNIVHNMQEAKNNIQKAMNVRNQVDRISSANKNLGSKSMDVDNINLVPPAIDIPAMSNMVRKDSNDSSNRNMSRGDDIVINLDGNKKKSNKKSKNSAKKSIFGLGGKKEKASKKKEKAKNNKKDSLASIFSWKKNEPENSNYSNHSNHSVNSVNEIMQGAAQRDSMINCGHVDLFKVEHKYREEQNRNIPYSSDNYHGNGYSASPSSPSPSAPSLDSDDGSTQLDGDDDNGTKLRYVGMGNYPRTIEVRIEVGQNFSIGRFDVSVGRKQSSFEFDKKTKAVSRRHAVIERNANGYVIVDLSSSAGTFVNGEKIVSNVAMPLHNGTRVSFGYAGADYIWEA